MMDNIIFFLGGNDLEMKTIEVLLKQRNIEYISKDLSWADASIDKYITQIKEKTANGYKVYGVELANPGNVIIDNYYPIDHHGIFEGNPSSLEQVCKLVGHEMTHYEELIAANDSRYIPGMKELHASDDEIRKIRSEDRKAQGVTDEEERVAELELNSVKEVEGCQGYYSVKTNLRHFSPLVDRIFANKDCDRLLVFSETEFTYYGKDKDDVKYRVECSKLHINGAYSGGGFAGFYGGTFDSTDIEWLENLCRPVISKHIYLFPFFNTNIDFSSFHTISWSQNSENWERVTLDLSNLNSYLYNELNYFYPHLHNILYDSSDDTCVRHFEYKVSSGDRYIIQIGKSDDRFELFIRISS